MVAPSPIARLGSSVYLEKLDPRVSKSQDRADVGCVTRARPCEAVRVRVGILGPLEVTDNGRAVAIGGIRLRTLLVRLALDAGRSVPVGALSAALWPEQQPAEPVNALQSLVSRLRATLPADVVAVPGGYRLDIDPDDVDALRFERLAREGRGLLAAGTHVEAAKVLNEALELWRGAALGDVGGATFAESVIARLDQLRLAAVEDMADAELAVLTDDANGATGADASDVLARLDELAAAHPWRERLHALRIRALVRSGRRAEALAAFDDVRRRLADEFGTDPGGELREAHLWALRHDDAVPARHLRGNVRAGLTELIGRADDVADLAARVCRDRLVTLVGPGGAGKTRLAQAVGAVLAEQATQVSGGVWLVELAPVSDPARVPQAVVDALGLRETGVPSRPEVPDDPVSRVVDAVSGRDTLLVLDNCEHVLDTVAHLVDALLGRCPALRIMATSRESLGVVGESLFDVRPLDLPEPGAPAVAAAAAPAVRLFADRARAVRPGFTVDDATVDDVVEICRRLDGLPLALELAAARLRSLPVGEVRRRLGERFGLLTQGSRTAPPRHRTLADVVAWSWELLDHDERRFAQRLALFPSTITPEGAAWVGGSAATLDLLASLVDKSLLHSVDEMQPRYRMLETIREYAQQRLIESGDDHEARKALIDYAVDLAERAEPHLRNAGQLPWLARLRSERDTLDAAAVLAREARDAVAVSRLAAASSLFWTIQLDHRDTVQRLERALSDAVGAPAEARATITAFYLFNAVLAGVTIDVGEDLPIGGTHPAHALIAPLVLLMRGEDVAAQAHVDQALDGAEPWARALLLFVRAMAGGTGGDMAVMNDDLEAAAAAFRECGERWGLLAALTIFGLALSMFGDGRAAGALEEAIRLRRELDPSDDAVEQRAWLAQIHAHAGRTDLAKPELAELVAGSPGRYVALAHHVLGDIARRDGDLAEARRQYDAGLEVERLAGGMLFAAGLSSSRAHLDLVVGDVDSARRQLDRALRDALRIRDMPLVAMVAVAVARLLDHQGDARGAAEVLGAAEMLRGAPDVLNPDIGELSERLRATLGERAHAEAVEHGRRLWHEDALELISHHARLR